MTARHQVMGVDPNAPHPGLAKRRPQTATPPGPPATQDRPAPAKQSDRFVAAPAVTVRGVNGSHGVFYAGQAVTPWTCNDGDDYADAAELERLTGLGMLTASGQKPQD